MHPILSDGAVDKLYVKRKVYYDQELHSEKKNREIYSDINHLSGITNVVLLVMLLVHVPLHFFCPRLLMPPLPLNCTIL